MPTTFAQSERAGQALLMTNQLQQRFVALLEKASLEAGLPTQLNPVEWLRDEGAHGGGTRFCAADAGIFQRATVNVSQVHYDDLAEKKLGSATAFSAIVHPANPFAASIHIHISWTEFKTGSGYWRVMADLNPALPDGEAKARFEKTLLAVQPSLYASAIEEGDRYFAIPVLSRHRGVVHFYLENYHTEDGAADAELAARLGAEVIDVYGELIATSLREHGSPTEQDKEQQLAYHTLYLFQVLTLDRGTTSGLLVHNQNDLGILGSLPGFVDKALLASWQERMPAPQGELLASFLDALGEQSQPEITDLVKVKFAQVIRDHYRLHPEALALQASAAVRPPSVENHQ